MPNQLPEEKSAPTPGEFRANAQEEIRCHNGRVRDDEQQTSTPPAPAAALSAEGEDASRNALLGAEGRGEETSLSHDEALPAQGEDASSREATPAQESAARRVWKDPLVRTVVIASSVVLVVVLLLFAVPLPYVARVPGPTVNVIGSYAQDGTARPLISIEGNDPRTGAPAQQNPLPSATFAPVSPGVPPASSAGEGAQDGQGGSATQPGAASPDAASPSQTPQGQLRMVTVSELGGPGYFMNAATLLQAWFTPSAQIVPYAQVYPPEVTGKQVEQLNRALMTGSQSTAKVAALEELGWTLPATVTITGTTPNSPLEGKVQEGDILRAIITPDGTEHPVTSASTPFSVMHALQPGSVIRVRVQRGQETLEYEAASAFSPQDPVGSKMGIYLDAQVEMPISIDFTLEKIGGPSAGLMFSLGIIDRLTPGGITGGESIAGTGTMSYDGYVGAIGGIQQKMTGARRDGARWFLAPASNCEDVVGHVPEGLQVVRVETLAQARSALGAIARGEGTTLPTCEAQ